MKKIVMEELKEQPIVRNTVALGVAIALVDYDITLLEGLDIVHLSRK